MATESAEEYLKRNSIKYKKKGPKEIVFKCPTCGKKDKASINSATWMWQCFSAECQSKGNEVSLKKAHGNIYDLHPTGSAKTTEEFSKEQLKNALKHKASAKSEIDMYCQALLAKPEALKYLTGERLITQETIKSVRLGWTPNVPGQSPQRRRGRRSSSGPGFVTIPCFTSEETTDCALMKCRDLRPDSKPKYLRVEGGESVLYAPARKIDTGKTLLVVGGEFDAIICYQLGYENVVSGTTGEGSWSEIWTRQIEACEDIVVIYDNDDGGRNGAEKLVKKLGQHRVRIGQWPEGAKDANEALVNDPEGFDVFALVKLVGDAKHQSISGLSTLDSAVDGYFDTLCAQGEASGLDTGFADLNELMGGWRPGEVTMITAGTGMGKTTWTSQLALIQAQFGQKVLFCPAELGIKRQIAKWARQHGGKDPKEMDDLERSKVRKELKELPMWSFWMPSDEYSIEALRNTLMYASSCLGIHFCVFDHIHHMVAEDSNERSKLSSLMKMFAYTAVQTGMHILVVAHPNQSATRSNKGKNRDDVLVQMADLKGTSSLKQNSDNVIALWRKRNHDRSEDEKSTRGYGKALAVVLKCRDDDGTEGSFPMYFEMDSARFMSTPAANKYNLEGSSISFKNWMDVDDDDD